MFELAEEFFLHLNSCFPLLHRPTFEKGIKAGLHLEDEGFGATVLLVCANGARFSQNPTVLPEGARNWHWAGWQWFRQVRDRRRLVPLTPARLYDLQVAAVSAAAADTGGRADRVGSFSRRTSRPLRCRTRCMLSSDTDSVSRRIWAPTGGRRTRRCLR